MPLINKETYSNGECALHLYEDGRVFISSGLVGFFIRPEEVSKMVELLQAYLDEKG